MQFWQSGFWATGFWSDGFWGDEDQPQPDPVSGFGGVHRPWQRNKRRHAQQLMIAVLIK